MWSLSGSEISGPENDQIVWSLSGSGRCLVLLHRDHLDPAGSAAGQPLSAQSTTAFAGDRGVIFPRNMATITALSINHEKEPVLQKLISIYSHTKSFRRASGVGRGRWVVGGGWWVVGDAQ